MISKSGASILEIFFMNFFPIYDNYWKKYSIIINYAINLILVAFCSKLNLYVVFSREKPVVFKSEFCYDMGLSLSLLVHGFHENEFKRSIKRGKYLESQFKGD